MKRHKIGVPVDKRLLVSWFHSSPKFFQIPIEVFQEIMSWEKIYKSNYSLSFYNQIKGWNITAPGTIRISDHWNFEINGKIHCKADPAIGQNTWAKGIYNAKEERYDISVLYHPNTDKEKFYEEINKVRMEFKNQYISTIGSAIEEGRRIATLVDRREVFYLCKGILYLVHRVKNDHIIIWKGEEKIKVKHSDGDLMHGTEVLKCELYSHQRTPNYKTKLKSVQAL